MLVPDDYEIESVSTTATVLIVIEKESSFSQLISNGCLNLCAGKCILVTGKGYPDVASRRLVKRLSEMMNMDNSDGPKQEQYLLKVMCLTDGAIRVHSNNVGDPHGFQIFLNYKYGSKVLPKGIQILICIGHGI
jgi:DNA topoisomerase VI subunit A